jgi:hypothetical protein
MAIGNLTKGFQSLKIGNSYPIGPHPIDDNRSIRDIYKNSSVPKAFYAGTNHETGERVFFIRDFDGVRIYKCSSNKEPVKINSLDGEVNAFPAELSEILDLLTSSNKEIGVIIDFIRRHREQEKIEAQEAYQKNN